MKKTLILLMLGFAFSFSTYASNEVTITMTLKNNNTISKKQLLHQANKTKMSKKTVRKLLQDNALSCYLQGYAWASTFELECSDGGSSTYVVSGISWELFCPEYGIYTTFSTDVQSSPSDGGC